MTCYVSSGTLNPTQWLSCLLRTTCKKFCQNRSGFVEDITENILGCFFSGSQCMCGPVCMWLTGVSSAHRSERRRRWDTEQHCRGAGQSADNHRQVLRVGSRLSTTRWQPLPSRYQWHRYYCPMSIAPGNTGNPLEFDVRTGSTGKPPSPPLGNMRVMVIVWRLRGNIITTALCWIVWHNVHSQQHTYVSSSYKSNRLGLSHWDPYGVCRGGCLELYYCNMVEWFCLNFKPDLDDQLVSFSALTLLVCSSGLQKSSPKWPIMCQVGRWTLHTHPWHLIGPSGKFLFPVIFVL